MTEDADLQAFLEEQKTRVRDIRVTTDGLPRWEEGMVRILVRSEGGSQELKVNEPELAELQEAIGRRRLNKIPEVQQLKEAIEAAQQHTEELAGAENTQRIDLQDAVMAEMRAWQQYAHALERILAENRDAEEAARLAGVAEEARRQKRNNTRAHGEAIGEALRACGISVQYALAGPVELWDVANQLEKRGYGAEMPAGTVPVRRIDLGDGIRALEAIELHDRAARLRKALETPQRSPEDVLKCMDAGTHKPVQHRDGKPPWCRTCGKTAAGTEPVSRIGRSEEDLAAWKQQATDGSWE